MVCRLMACFKPITAFQAKDGEITFQEQKNTRAIELPCGQCIGCRITRSKHWATRCIHEASLHPDNSFITLTYNPENLPPDGGLIKSDFQKFMKRLRRRYPKKKSDFINAASMAIKTTGLITTLFSLIIILMIGYIYMIALLVNPSLQALH